MDKSFIFNKSDDINHETEQETKRQFDGQMHLNSLKTKEEMKTKMFSSNATMIS